ncbi:hypothetical protein U1Q18_040299 [Sarracenia purpurea var. burkii]
MKGLSPLRIKNFTKELQSSAGANLQRAEGVIFNASPMADADHVVNTGEKDGKYVSGDEAVKEGALLDESIASLTDDEDEQSAREGFEESVKVGPSIDNSAPLDSATAGEDSVADSDEDGSDPEDSGSEVKGNVPAAVAGYREEDSGMEIKSTEIEVDDGAFSPGGEEIEVTSGVEYPSAIGTEQGGRRSSTPKPAEPCVSAAEKHFFGGDLKSGAIEKTLFFEDAKGNNEVESREAQGKASLASKKTVQLVGQLAATSFDLPAKQICDKIIFYPLITIQDP